MVMEWNPIKSNSNWSDLVGSYAHFRYFSCELSKWQNEILNYTYENKTPPFFSVPILIYTEAYGQKIKSNRYYYCVTFFFYESIPLLSIVTFVYTMIHTKYIDKHMKSLQNAPPYGKDFFLSLSTLLQWIMFGIVYFSLSIRNSFLHVSLCRCKLFAVSKKKFCVKFWAIKKINWFELANVGCK